MPLSALAPPRANVVAICQEELRDVLRDAACRRCLRLAVENYSASLRMSYPAQWLHNARFIGLTRRH